MFSVEFTKDHDKKAWEWYVQHAPDVQLLVSKAKSEFPPSGSDICQPELWKAGNWKWFLDRSHLFFKD